MRVFRSFLWLVLPLFLIVAVVLGTLRSSFLRSAGGPGEEFKLLARAPSRGLGLPPVFAYWISGTGGETEKILRLLKAVYHPRNRYLLHMDAGSSTEERTRLAISVRSESVFRTFRNVDVVGKGYAVDRTGSSALAATLHGAAVLLRIGGDWDWFITLSSSDYPVVTQDDLLYAFTAVPRDLNFVDHTSHLGWKEYERFDKIVVDPSLHLNTTTQSFFATEIRKTPDAFKIFTGSPWVILSKPFLEHCIHGWDNLPRKLLLYFTNVAYPVESYFQTLLCNSPEFRNTTVNNDLRYFVWDDPPKLEPLILNKTHYKPIVRSGAAFARRFAENDPVLKKLDKKVLRRSAGAVVHGRWCSGLVGKRGMKTLVRDPCLSWGDINVVEPGPYGRRLKSLVSLLISEERLHSNQCESL
uniref:Xylosyltransferase 1 n=1 Tax=Anthurium amnicola TaxID=1678845 RepID=A0A1D1Z8Q2_9ARAE